MLILAATPIGDVADAAPSLLRALSSADVIAAEDTRRFRQLLNRLDFEVDARIVSYFDGNEASRAASLLDDLLADKTVVVVTDAGMPVVSDPGFRLVELAIGAGIKVTSVPGPSAVLTALAVSGLPAARFAFEGFLPRKAGERRRRLEGLRADDRTLIFFEAPHRLVDLLTDVELVFGDRRIAVCRELTKTYEEVIRGTVSQVLAGLGEVLGEITVVVEGASQADSGDLVEAAAKVVELVEAGLRFKKAVTEVAALMGVDKGELYDAAIAARKER